MIRILTFLSLLIPCALMGQVISRTELRSTNTLIDGRIMAASNNVVVWANAGFSAYGAALQADAASKYISINDGVATGILDVQDAILDFGFPNGLYFTDSAGQGDFLLGTVSGQVPTWNGSSWITAAPESLRVVVNYAYASSIVIDLSTDVDASITNNVTGNMNVLVTNAVPGRSFRLWFTSDGSARTFNIFSDKSIVMLSTNETLNSTQVVSTASKDGIINGAARRKTATATNLNLWAKSQP